MSDEILGLCVGSLAVILALCGLFLPYSPTIYNLNNGLVLWLPLNDGSGNASDYSGCLNHGVISGASWVDGKFGKSLSFNGIADYVEIPKSSSLDITSNITLSAWVYLGSLPYVYGGIIEGQQPNYDYLLYYSGTHRTFNTFMMTDSGTYHTDTDNNTAIAQIGWNYVVGVYDGSYVRIYLNGILSESVVASGSILITGNGVRLGTFAGAYFLNEIIDDVRVYNRVLIQTEISALYNNTLNVVIP